MYVRDVLEEFLQQVTCAQVYPARQHDGTKIGRLSFYLLQYYVFCAVNGDPGEIEADASGGCMSVLISSMPRGCTCNTACLLRNCCSCEQCRHEGHTGMQVGASALRTQSAFKPSKVWPNMWSFWGKSYTKKKTIRPGSVQHQT